GLGCRRGRHGRRTARERSVEAIEVRFERIARRGGRRRLRRRLGRRGRTDGALRGRRTAPHARGLLAGQQVLDAADHELRFKWLHEDSLAPPPPPPPFLAPL